MDKELVGTLGLLVGIVPLSFGFFLKKKFKDEANYRGIGSFRVTPGGLKWLAGYLLFIFGISVVLVSVMLLCL